MKINTTSRGFRELIHPEYPPKKDSRLLLESSAVGDYEDSLDRPGSSFLWVGENHHLSREEVEQLIFHLQHWLDRKRLPKPKEPT